MICKLVNKIFDEGYFPESWLEGSIIPLYKGGNVNDVNNNYRVITLLSNISKIYTRIFNDRLVEWTKRTDNLSEAQSGFKKVYTIIMRTVDTIFAF